MSSLCAPFFKKVSSTESQNVIAGSEGIILARKIDQVVAHVAQPAINRQDPAANLKKQDLIIDQSWNEIPLKLSKVRKKNVLDPQTNHVTLNNILCIYSRVKFIEILSDLIYYKFAPFDPKFPLIQPPELTVKAQAATTQFVESLLASQTNWHPPFALKFNDDKKIWIVNSKLIQLMQEILKKSDCTQLNFYTFSGKIEPQAFKKLLLTSDISSITLHPSHEKGPIAQVVQEVFKTT